MAAPETYFEVYRESDGARFALVGAEADNVFEEMAKNGFVKVGAPPEEETSTPEQEPETESSLKGETGNSTQEQAAENEPTAPEGESQTFRPRKAS